MTDDRTLRTSRALPYSPREIYGTFAAPDLLAQWWGPEGFSNTFEVFDFTEGGRWTFVMHGPDGTSYRNESYFAALEPASRIVIRHDCAPYFTLTVTLEPSGDGTLLTWAQVFDDAKTALAVQKRVGPANEQNLDRLSRVLARATDAT